MQEERDWERKKKKNDGTRLKASPSSSIRKRKSKDVEQEHHTFVILERGMKGRKKSPAPDMSYTTTSNLSFPAFDRLPFPALVFCAKNIFFSFFFRFRCLSHEGEL